ncbi:hypothetical protein TFLX_04193 [Thermoflexales bacterium]|nr:hypothetical protein TFLX_04193 [Thermoflexales bacterium]
MFENGLTSPATARKHSKRTRLKNRLSYGILLAVIILLFSSCTGNRSEAHKSGTKIHPGHYVAVGTFFEISKIKYLDEPAVQGVNKRYLWQTLEPEQGVYDFSSIEKDLDYLAAHDKQLIVFLLDKSFAEEGALPSYLSEYDLLAEGGEFSPVRWHPFFIERFVALGKSLGERFDSHPNFEGIAIQESSLGITEEGYKAFGYTPEKYRDALVAMLTGLQDALPNSHVFWYSNFLPGNDDYLRQVADAIEGSRVLMGGPDILPYRRFLGRVSYPMYEEYQQRLTLFCSAQDDSYRHHKNDNRVDEQEPIPEEGYLTMEEIFLFARDSLHVRYLFWEYYYAGVERGERSYDEAIEVIRKHPSFNDSLGLRSYGESR